MHSLKPDPFDLSPREQAHVKLVKETPPRFLGLIGAKVDQRTLALSTRLEGFLDVEANTFAVLPLLRPAVDLRANI